MFAPPPGLGRETLMPSTKYWSACTAVEHESASIGLRACTLTRRLTHSPFVRRGVIPMKCRGARARQVLGVADRSAIDDGVDFAAPRKFPSLAIDGAPADAAAASRDPPHERGVAASRKIAGRDWRASSVPVHAKLGQEAPPARRHDGTFGLGGVFAADSSAIVGITGLARLSTQSIPVFAARIACLRSLTARRIQAARAAAAARAVGLGWSRAGFVRFRLPASSRMAPFMITEHRVTEAREYSSLATRCLGASVPRQWQAPHV